MVSKKSTPKSKIVFASGEKNFHLIFEEYSAILLLIEPISGAILAANQAAVSFYGYSRTKLCGMSINEINTLPPEQVEAERQKALNEERNYFVFPHRVSSGEERIVEVHSSPVALQEKQVLFSIIRDITERTRTEQMLHSADRQWQTIFDSMGDAVCLIDLEGHIVKHNHAMEVFLGKPANKINGCLCCEVVHDSPKPIANCPVVCMKITRHRECIILERNGRWLEITADPILDSDGQLVSAVHTIVDITERKQAEEALREAQLFNQKILEMTPSTIYIFDLDTQQVVFVNHTLASVLGYAPEHTARVGSTFFPADVHPDDMHILHEKLNWIATAQAGEVESREYRVRHANGEWRWIGVREIIFSRGDNGASIQIMGIARDFTERKQAEEALRDNELFVKGVLNSFTANIAVLDEQGVIVTVNDAWINYGRENGSLNSTGFVGSNYLAACQAAIQQGNPLARRVDRAIRAVLNGSQSEFSAEYPCDSPTRQCWFTMTVLPQHKPRKGAIVIHQDITDRKQTEEALRESEARNHALMDAMPDLIFVQNREGVFIDYQVNGSQLLITPPEFFLGRTSHDVLPPTLANDLQLKFDLAFQMGEIQTHEYVLELADGQHYFETRMNAYEEDRLLSIVRDVTERKQAEDELHYMKKSLEAANIELQAALVREKQVAHTDVLTGINNRRHLYELAEHEFEIATRYQQPLSVILFDIDHFKKVNDTYGHAVGDQVLQLVTQIACAELRSADVIGRYGGEEFVIVLPMTNAQQARSLAERIRTGMMKTRVSTQKGDVVVTLSIGTVEIYHGAQTGSVENLIRRADEAMYIAKNAGGNWTENGEPE